MLQDQFGIARDPNPLQMAFLRWQCRVRQMAMRDQEGRPDDAITPAVYLAGESEPMGHIITLLNKSPGYSVTAELEYMAAKTNDPAQRRDQALQFLSAAYYQKAAEFSDILTATFPPGSEGAKTLHEAGQVTLVFEAFNQRFDLLCKVWRLADHNPLYTATIAHNRMFNPGLPPGTEVLGFEPDWSSSNAEPPLR
ncbi:hypothetical protein ACM25N_03160 [Roseovarius sp. C7]|uniref:hypothetical protein n=1 Tax=Roseovarius sp. C7 TaxID=3398643 RepID=UPI0039F551E1